MMRVKKCEGLEEVPLPSNRSFGLVFCVFFLIVGTLPLYSGRPLRLWALTVGGLFLGAALISPDRLSLLNRLWMKFGQRMHKIMSPFIIGIFFFGVITPFGLLMRIFRRSPMLMRFDPELKSYWINRTPHGPSPQNMDNQF